MDAACKIRVGGTATMRLAKVRRSKPQLVSHWSVTLRKVIETDYVGCGLKLAKQLMVTVPFVTMITLSGMDLPSTYQSTRMSWARMAADSMACTAILFPSSVSISLSLS
jgi:hypothetical protein